VNTPYSASRSFRAIWRHKWDIRDITQDLSTGSSKIAILTSPQQCSPHHSQMRLCACLTDKHLLLKLNSGCLNVNIFFSSYIERWTWNGQHYMLWYTRCIASAFMSCTCQCTAHSRTIPASKWETGIRIDHWTSPSPTANTSMSRLMATQYIGVIAISPTLLGPNGLDPPSHNTSPQNLLKGQGQSSCTDNQL